MPATRLGARLVLRFGPADVGRRVTLRRRLPGAPADGPGLGDVVGVLEAWTDGRLRVRRRTGELVEVEEDSVVAGRVVAPEVAAGTLDEIADDTWRADENDRLGDWRLRAHGGVTHRPNAALAVGDPGLPLDAALDRTVAWYAERGLRPAVMTPLPAPVADVATARGWTVERRTLVLAGAAKDAADAAGGLPDGLRLELTDDLPDDWDRVLARLTDPDVAPRYRRLLTTTPGAVFATVRDPDGVPLAVARGASAQGWTNLTNVEVVPAARDRGLGRAVTAALARASLERGVRHVLLQVWPDNDVALRLYTRLGMTEHHAYAYLVPPGSGPAGYR